MPSPDLYDDADLYCAAFDWPVGDEVDWVLEQAPGARSVLEPFCGHARFATAFVERGVRYHGFDRAPAMLAHAPRRDGVTVSRADAASFTAPGAPFDLGWCPINSLRHLLDEADVVSHLACMREHLAPGAPYVVESDFIDHDGPWEQPVDEKSSWTMPVGDDAVKATWCIDRCDRARRRVWERARIELIADDTVVRCVEHTYEMRLYTTDDWPRLAAAGGFAVERVHAHRSGNRRPEVALSSALDNCGENFYLVLRSRT